jgi:transcriptional regulator with XRE-family HTH domain
MRIEQEGRVPGVDIVERLAEVLRISPGWLAYAPLQEVTPETTSASRQEGAPLLCAEMGARLRALRQERGLSLRALAEVAGLTAGGIGSIETGRTLPSVATAEALARGLGVSPGWLVYREGPQVVPRAPRRRKGVGWRARRVP